MRAGKIGFDEIDDKLPYCMHGFAGSVAIAIALNL